METKDLPEVLAAADKQLRELETSNQAFVELVAQVRQAVLLGNAVLDDNEITKRLLQDCERELNTANGQLSKVGGQIVASHLAISEGQSNFVKLSEGNMEKIQLLLERNNAAISGLRDMVVHVTSERFSKLDAEMVLNRKEMAETNKTLTSADATLQDVKEGLIDTHRIANKNTKLLQFLLTGLLVLGALGLWIKYGS